MCEHPARLAPPQALYANVRRVAGGGESKLMHSVVLVPPPQRGASAGLWLEEELWHGPLRCLELTTNREQRRGSAAFSHGAAAAAAAARGAAKI